MKGQELYTNLNFMIINEQRYVYIGTIDNTT